MAKRYSINAEFGAIIEDEHLEAISTAMEDILEDMVATVGQFTGIDELEMVTFGVDELEQLPLADDEE